MDGNAQPDWLSALTRVSAGEWKGWWSFGGLDPFEDLVGPFYFRREADGSTRSAFRAEPRHMNGAGFMHGGCLMSFADFALFVIAHEQLADQRAVTATFNCEFIGSVRPGTLLEARGEVVKAGRSLVFARGTIVAAEEPVLSFSGVLKKTGTRPKA